MSAATMTAPQANGTHQDRPTAKVQPPFRIVGGRFPRIEWDQIILMPDKSSKTITMNHLIEGSGYGNQIGLRVKELLEMYHAVSGQVDGLLADVDRLTTENVLLTREVEKLTNQLAEARRSNSKQSSKKGD